MSTKTDSPSNPTAPICPPDTEALDVSPSPTLGEGIARGETPGPAGPSRRPKKSSTIEQMRQDLADLGLDTKGRKTTLWKRLVKAFQQALYLQGLDAAEASGSEADSDVEAVEKVDEKTKAKEKWKAFLCFDVEATCRGGTEFDWPNEIIEFPVVLLKWATDGERKLEHVDTFHSYVKPTWSPLLSDFCTTLTGITQEMVDKSPTFIEMLPLLEEWMAKHDLLDDDGKLKNAMWVTDGPWDLRDFIPKQLHITPPPSGPPPYFFSPYLNIKSAVQTVLAETYLREQYSKKHPGFVDHDGKRGKITTAKHMGKRVRYNWTGPDFYHTIPGQLSAFGLDAFKGRQHSGIDDATNVSRILIAISERDVVIEPNSHGIHPNNTRKWPWMGAPGVVRWEDSMSDNKDNLANRQPKETETTPHLSIPVAQGDTKEEVEDKGCEYVTKKSKNGKLRAIKVATDTVSAVKNGLLAKGLPVEVVSMGTEPATESRSSEIHDPDTGKAQQVPAGEP